MMDLSRSLSVRQTAVLLGIVAGHHVHARNIVSTPIVPRLENGMAITPPMGWNSYNHYNCYANQSVLESNAAALVTFGLDKLGYIYVTPDCGWALEDRLPNGSLTWNPYYYPDGFPYLANYMHSLGLKFGVYSDAGIEMCGPVGNGSLFHETFDAMTFASWGADALKYDNCYSEASAGYPNVDYTPPNSPAPRYQNMTNALNATGREFLFSICEWGVDFPSLWAPALGNTWRITNDIIPDWRTVYRQVNQFVPSALFAGPGQWPDLDMLEVGNNVFSEWEEQTHFTLWAICKSPLIIGGILNSTYETIVPYSLAILQNTDIIGYNQDSLGKAANLVRRYTDEQYDVWAGPLSGGRTVVAIVNWADNNSTINFNLPDVGFQTAKSTWDVWNKKESSNVMTTYTTTIAPHGVTVLELDGTSPSGTYSAAQFATSKGAATTFTSIYGLTTSPNYPITITLASALSKKRTITITSSASPKQKFHVQVPSGATSFTATLPLLSSASNTIKIASGASNPVSSISVGSAPSTFYNASQFALADQATFVSCPAGSCLPTGTKLGYLGVYGSATVSIPYNATNPFNPSLTAPYTKYVEVTYCNNDIAFSGSFGYAPNARNVTLQVNSDAVTRLEVPLSANVSELFAWDGGYGSCATLGVDVAGFGTGSNGVDMLTLGNQGGENGYTAYAPDVVGVRIFG